MPPTKSSSVRPSASRTRAPRPLGATSAGTASGRPRSRAERAQRALVGLGRELALARRRAHRLDQRLCRLAHARARRASDSQRTSLRAGHRRRAYRPAGNAGLRSSSAAPRVAIVAAVSAVRERLRHPLGRRSPMPSLSCADAAEHDRRLAARRYAAEMALRDAALRERRRRAPRGARRAPNRRTSRWCARRGVPRPPMPLAGELTVATYNVHRWTGLNGAQPPDPARAGFVISELDADVIALQEVLRPVRGDDPLERARRRARPARGVRRDARAPARRDRQRDPLALADHERVRCSTSRSRASSGASAVAAQFTGRRRPRSTSSRRTSRSSTARASRQVESLLDHPQLQGAVAPAGRHERVAALPGDAHARARARRGRPERVAAHLPGRAPRARARPDLRARRRRSRRSTRTRARRAPRLGSPAGGRAREARLAPAPPC